MAIAGLPIIKHFGLKAWDNIKSSSQQQRYLAYGGLGNIVTNRLMGGSSGLVGAVDFGLDLAAMFSVCNPAFAFYVAVAYGAKAIVHALYAAYCAATGKPGATANLIIAGVTIASILPFTRLGNVLNKARKIRPLTDVEAKPFTLVAKFDLTNPRSTLFGHDRMKVLRKNAGRLKGDVEVEKSLFDGFDKTTKKLEDKLASNADSVFNEGLKETNPNRVKVKVQHATKDPKGVGKVRDFNLDLAKEAQTKLDDLTEQTRIGLDRAKAELKQQTEKVTKLDEATQKAKKGAPKKEARARLRKAETQLDKLTEVESNATSRLKELEKKQKTFADDTKAWQEACKERTTVKTDRLEVMEGHLKAAEEARDSAIELNQSILGKKGAKKLTLNQIRDRELDIINKCNGSLHTSTFEAEELVRQLGKEAYGEQEAESLVGIFNWFKRDPKVQKKTVSEALFNFVAKPFRAIREFCRKVWAASKPTAKTQVTAQEFTFSADTVGNVIDNIKLPAAPTPLATG